MAGRAESALMTGVAEGRFGDPADAERVRDSIARGDLEGALDVIDDAVEEVQEPTFWLHLESAAKELELGGRAIFYRRRYAATSLTNAIAAGRFSDPDAPLRARQLSERGVLERAFDLLEAAAEKDQDAGFWASMADAADGYGLEVRALRYRFPPAPAAPAPTYIDTIEDVLRRELGVTDGMQALLSHCNDTAPNRVWEEMAALDYEGGVNDIRAWLLQRAPIGDDVEVLWFAMWDVTTGFDLRGSTSWSRDPEDWEWWYHDDFNAGSCTPPILDAMHALARGADDPDGDADEDAGDGQGVYGLTDLLLTLAFVSLAAVQILRGLGGPRALGREEGLWAVSGHPDEVHGMILGRLSEDGFEPGVGVR